MPTIFDLKFDPFFGDARDRNLRELFYPFIGCCILLCLRIFLIKFVFARIGIQYGLKKIKCKKPTPNPILEKAYRKSKKWSQREISGLTKQLDMNREQLEQWLKLRLANDRPTVLHKLFNSLWELFYSGGSSIFGFVVLFDKVWIWNFEECWSDLGNQVVPNDVWWYFMLGFSFAWSQLFGLVFAINRKDFYAMVVHHLVYILAMSLAWSSNFFRYATVSILTSDLCHVFIEASKVAKYLKYEKLAVFVFVIFMFVWLVVRCSLQLLLVLSIAVDAPKSTPTLANYFFYYVLVSCACVFYMLTIIWSYFIVKVVLMILRTGKMQDARSENDD